MKWHFKTPAKNLYLLNGRPYKLSCALTKFVSQDQLLQGFLSQSQRTFVFFFIQDQMWRMRIYIYIFFFFTLLYSRPNVKNVNIKVKVDNKVYSLIMQAVL